MPRPTIRDVAKAAGVSLATVDRVLNARNGVRQANETRVFAAMKALNYERDIAAANLSKRREYRIMFVLPKGGNTFMRELEAGVESFRATFGRERVRLGILTVPAFDGDELAEAMNRIDATEVDGVAVVATDAPIVVVHELTRYASSELQSGVFDAVINQDIGHEIPSAVRVLTALIDGRTIVPSQERIWVEIFIRYNLP